MGPLVLRVRKLSIMVIRGKKEKGINHKSGEWFFLLAGKNISNLKGKPQSLGFQKVLGQEGQTSPYVCVCALIHSVVSNSVQLYGLQHARLLCPWDSPGKNAGVCYHALLQRIFPSQGSDLCLLRLLHWQTGSLPPDSFPAIRVMNYWSEELREMCGQTVHVPLLTSIHRDDALLAVEVGFFKSMNTLHLSNNLLCWEL